MGHGTGQLVRAGRAARGLLCRLACAALLLAPDALAAPAAAQLRLEVDTPADGAEIGGTRGLVFVAGTALASAGERRTFDIVFVLDTSKSTGNAAGPGIGGKRTPAPARSAATERILPVWNEPEQTVLAAEIEAVRALIAQLEPRTTRVGIVSFAGDANRATPDAHTELELTDDYSRAEAALGDLGKRSPSGLTNMVAAVDVALAELLGTKSAASQPRPGARRVVVFMSDGDPNPPRARDAQQAIEAVLEHVARARAAEVRIDSFALGRDALAQPLVTVEMAARTGGVFTPVVRPADLRAVFEDIDLAEVAELAITNLTTGAHASQLTLGADGNFAALLELARGRNVVEIRARATDGTRALQRRVLSYLPDASAQPLDPRQLARRNRMLEAQLLELRRRNLEIEADRDAKLREALREEIRSEREKAQQRAAEVSKELEIEVER